MTPGDERHFQPRHRILAVALAVALSAAACGGGDGGADANPLAGTRWEVTSIHDGATLQGAHPTTIVTIVFGPDTAEGYDGCNRYVVPYGVDGNRVTFGDISSTGAACISVEHTDQAAAVLEAVGRITGFDLSGNELELSHDATGLLRMRRADDLVLTGISWRMTGYRASAGGLTSPLDGAPVTLWFGDDGTVVGSAGCNSFGADYTRTAARLSIGRVASTEMACNEPAGVMVQEIEVLSLLPVASSFQTDMTSLELFDADDEVIATFAFGGRTR